MQSKNSAKNKQIVIPKHHPSLSAMLLKTATQKSTAEAKEIIEKKVWMDNVQYEAIHILNQTQDPKIKLIIDSLIRFDGKTWSDFQALILDDQYTGKLKEELESAKDNNQALYALCKEIANSKWKDVKTTYGCETFDGIHKRLLNKFAENGIELVKKTKNTVMIEQVLAGLKSLMLNACIIKLQDFIFINTDDLKEPNELAMIKQTNKSIRKKLINFKGKLVKASKDKLPALKSDKIDYIINTNNLSRDDLISAASFKIQEAEKFFENVSKMLSGEIENYFNGKSPYSEDSLKEFKRLLEDLCKDQHWKPCLESLNGLEGKSFVEEELAKQSKAQFFVAQETVEKLENDSAMPKIINQLNNMQLPNQEEEKKQESSIESAQKQNPQIKSFAGKVLEEKKQTQQASNQEEEKQENSHSYAKNELEKRKSILKDMASGRKTPNQQQK